MPRQLLGLISTTSAIVLTILWLRGDLEFGLRMAASAVGDGSMQGPLVNLLGPIIHIVYGTAIAFLLWHTGAWEAIVESLKNLRLIIRYWALNALDRMAPEDIPGAEPEPEDPVMTALKAINSNVIKVAEKQDKLRSRVAAIEAKAEAEAHIKDEAAAEAAAETKPAARATAATKRAKA